jgi:glucose uptake protein GlcU
MKMKRVKILLQIGVAPLILMAYGWYLGQLHQSGYDIAGIFLFLTGAIGLVSALAFQYFTRKYPWHDRWYLNVLTGVVGCGNIFALILAFARLHK